VNGDTTGQPKRGSLVPGLLISGAAIVALVVFVDFSQSIDALRSAEPVPMIAATVLFAIALTGRAAASRELVDGRTGLGGAFAALNLGYLANNLLPLRAGEAVRSLVLGRKTGLGLIGGATAVAAERLLDLIFAATILLAGLSAVGVEAPWAPAAAAAAVAATGVTALILIARNRHTAAGWLEPKIARWPRVAGLLPKLVAALEGLAQPGRLLRATVVLGLAWFGGLIVFWIAMRSFIPGAPLSWTAFGLGVMAFGIALPSSPGAIGVYEAMWVAALTLCGADPAASLAYGIAIHTMTFSVTSLFGLIALVMEVRTGAGFIDRAKRVLTGGDRSTAP
jgi:uncharacterized membrane protein YbhN (UPF0104 family)